MEVTLSRGSESISIPLVEESGEILFAADFGLPELQLYESGGTLYPRTQSQWSGNLNYSLVGRLFDYQTAHELADLIATCDPSNPLELTNPLPEYDSPVTVAPSAGAEQALSLSFPPGKKRNVNVELQLTRVSETLGGITQEATTPTTSGSGPIQITAGSTTVDLPKTDLEVERGVGRPNDVVRRSQDTYPRYIQKPKTTFDEFTITFQSIQDIPSTMTDLTNAIFDTQLGRTPVFVDFQGLYGLGEIAAMPTGSAPFRQIRQAGEKNTIIAPTVALRRVYSE